MLWSATFVSNLGDGIRLTALPLLATELTRDPRLIAGVAVAERIPWVLFILPGGAWADRYDRRRLRVLLDVLRAMIVGLLALLVGVDAASIWLVYAAAAAMASAESIVDSSSMALVPALVPDEQLERAGGRMSAAELVANTLIGPPLGGLLFAAAFWLPFGADAVTFVVAAALVAGIGGRFRPRERDLAPPTSLGSDIADGLRWLWGQPLIRNLALISTALGTISYLPTAVLVLFAREELGLGAVGYGVLMIPPAIGGSIGAMLAGRLTRFPLRWVLAGSIGVGGAMGVLVGVSQQAWMAAALMAIQMGSVMVWNVLTVALRQRTIPDRLLGRVGASYRFLVYFGMPLGALLGGLFADWFGIRETLVIAGCALVAVSLAIPALVPADQASGRSGELRSVL